jgi:SpoVK/Ycf46/Vps4 family AAA+-type ATPase
MSISEFLMDLKKSDTKIKGYFNDIDLLEKSLRELDNVIGMKKVKSQILKQIKTFISNKAKGIYRENDRKHCLLCGPPGCGKTTVGKILCKVWIAIGFIGSNISGGPKKVATFNKAQDELIRKQRQDIKEYKEKLNNAISLIQVNSRCTILCKRVIVNLIRMKNGKPNSQLDDMINDLSSVNNTMEEVNKSIEKLRKVKSTNMQGFGIETDSNLISTKEESELPFHVYNRNDVVSRYVGDTSHRCTKAMNEALDGVAYFDEAYNLCSDTRGLGDSYGHEALTVINQYMDEHADKLIVVFAGYKEDIYNNLFRAQKGLESRFTNKFEIEQYTPDELTLIFIQRLKYAEWYIDESEELHTIIRENFDLFKYQGRDMDTLALYTKNIISERLYEGIMNGEKITDKIEDLNIVREAVEMFKNNMIGSIKEEKYDFEKLANLLQA